MPVSKVPRQLPGRNRRFAARALRVESALACDQQAGAAESFFEADFPHEPGGSGLQVRPQERRQPEPEAARGAGAGDGRNVDAEISAHHLGQMPETLVEDFDLARVGPLLGRVHGSGAGFAEEHVVDVTGDREREQHPAPVEARAVYPSQPAQAAAALR